MPESALFHLRRNDRSGSKGEWEKSEKSGVSLLCFASSPRETRALSVVTSGSMEPGLYVGPCQIVEHYQADEKSEDIELDD